MSLSFLAAHLRHPFVTSSRLRLLFRYSAAWTILLTATVAVASFAPEAAFVSAISVSSSFSKGCEQEGSVRVPLDVPGEVLCFPARLFTRSVTDSIVSLVFAALVVAGSTFLVRAMGSWEGD